MPCRDSHAKLRSEVSWGRNGLEMAAEMSRKLVAIYGENEGEMPRVKLRSEVSWTRNEPGIACQIATDSPSFTP